MNSVQTVIIFFAFLFAGSLFYSKKRKSDTLFSFMVNLELEYIIVGAALFLMMDRMPIPMATLDGGMYLLLAFMGLALGSHFSIKLLMDVPFRFYLLTLSLYIALMPLLYFTLLSAGCHSPLMMAISLNTLMPYSINLSMKLFRIPKDSVFTSNLTASLFPLVTLIAYTVAAGLVDYRPADFSKAAMGALALTFVFLHYGKARTKKNLHTLSILFVVMISGIALYYKISPLVLGFLTGLVKADTKYGNMFQDISITFERILYIFFYVALGLMLGYGFDLSLRTLATAAAGFASIYAVRKLLAGYLVHRLMPTKGEIVCLVSTGILPAVLLLDYATRFGYSVVAPLFMPFFLIHLAAELTTYFMMKNERKNN